MPVNGVRGTADFDLVFDKIRAIHPLVPIFVFGGHTHIRDCQQMDGRSMSIESGRYMESEFLQCETISRHASTSSLRPDSTSPRGDSTDLNLSFLRSYLSHRLVSELFPSLTQLLPSRATLNGFLASFRLEPTRLRFYRQPHDQQAIHRHQPELLRVAHEEGFGLRYSVRSGLRSSSRLAFLR